MLVLVPLVLVPRASALAVVLVQLVSALTLMLKMVLVPLASALTLMLGSKMS